jgi:uncharacterized protein YdcH (DUF465 family)
LKEQELVEFLKNENEEFRKLSEEHRNLDEFLVEIDSRRYLTPGEEIERKNIQKQKLLLKDRMAELIRKYKESYSIN